MESRTQGSRPRTQKNPRPRPRIALPRTEPLEAKDQGHRRKCSPREKKGLQKFFQAISNREKQKRSSQFSARFLAFSNKVLTVQKIVLSSSRGQGNFRELEASRPSQDQGLDLRGQGLQNVSSRTPSLVAKLPHVQMRTGTVHTMLQ